MQAERFDGAAAFLDAALGHLTGAEAANNLILGVARRLAGGRRVGQGEPLCAGVRDDAGVIVGAALWTPPWRMLLSLMPAAPAARLAEAVWSWGLRPSGVVGPAESARSFCQRLAGEARVVRSMRVFELRAVTVPRPTAGAMRAAADADRDLATQWFLEFRAEARLDDPGDPREMARAALDEGRVFFWDDEGPASMATVARTLAGGTAIGAVYTPPARRGRGHATALVAALSQKLLDGGASFCCLFTDLANTTSSAIYQKVGYSAVCDFVEMDLTT